MFEKFKELAELKKMQDAMKRESVTAERNGVTVVMNGSFEVQELKLNPSLGGEDQQKAVMEALNEAREGVQKKMAQSVMGMMRPKS